MEYKVVTHNGKAHIDEIVAIALLSIHLKSLPSKIKRVNHELASKMINSGLISKKLYYIDCGKEFNVKRNIFDHHHDNLPSSAKLVFDTFFSEYLNTDFGKFISTLSLVDNYGPNSLSDFDVNSDSVNYFKFPLGLLLDLFRDKPLLVIETFKNAIEKYLKSIKYMELAQKWLENPKNVEIIKYLNLNILIYNHPPNNEIAPYVKSMDGEVIENNDIDVIYSFDRDNKNIRVLFRTLKGDGKLDFTNVISTTAVFSHNSGFLFKFIPKNKKEYLSIIEEAKLV